MVALVKADPMYRFSESTTSPKTRTSFEGIRRGLLPQIIQESYDTAKAAYDRKDSAEAMVRFDRVLALLDEPGMSDPPNMADLKRLASGFRDLSKAAVAAATPPVAKVPELPPAAPAPKPAAPEAPRIYSGEDTDV